jgi:hypothetical protein
VMTDLIWEKQKRPKDGETVFKIRGELRDADRARTFFRHHGSSAVLLAFRRVHWVCYLKEQSIGGAVRYKMCWLERKADSMGDFCSFDTN